MPTTVQEYALTLLSSGSLDDKLRPARTETGAPLVDPRGDSYTLPILPCRDERIALAHGAPRLPALKELTDAGARARCLERFAHHELCAVEMFAWALLAFPDAPPAVRRGLLQTLVEEQLHLSLYLERLDAHDYAFGSGALSDYLWQHVPRILEAEQPLLAFLCAMGLTLEQANLDFSLLYRDAFRAVGDEESAKVFQRVHDDEVRHVRFAAHWIRALSEEPNDAEAYLRHVPFPLSAARAKARRFDRAARRRAGLSDDLIELVEKARPTHQTS